MQQVASREFFAAAEPVDLSELPVPVQVRRTRGRQVVTALSYAWVLHRRAINTALSVLLLAGLAVCVYQLRQPIATGVEMGTSFVEGKLASAGLGIKTIEISGQQLTREQDIFALLMLDNGRSTISYDVDKARQRLTWLRAVESASVRRVYPDRLEVSLVEREPVARWRTDGRTYLVDAQGRRIGVAENGFNDLPLVIGSGAADDAQVIIRALESHGRVGQGVAALSRIGDRRWDIIYHNGLRVQLPETGVGQALERLETWQRDYALLERDVTVIDLRVPGILSVTPGEDAKKQIEAERKAAARRR